MEASSHRRPPIRPLGAAATPGVAQRAGRGFVGPLKGIARTAGELSDFVWRTLIEVPGTWRYSAEVLRQAGVLITGSALIIWFMEFVMGVTCATEANYVLRGYGATVYTGLFVDMCGFREMSPYMWGYILAAKVGCGLVAEIGAMRINEELDAMESMGITPMRFVIATRLIAAWLAFPAIYIVGLGIHYIAVYLVLLVQIGEVSRGGFETVFWSFANVSEIVYSLIKAMAIGTAIVLIGMFYGYRASGGPVGVGTATARSMILNLMVLHVIGALLTMLFWGLSPKMPIGG